VAAVFFWVAAPVAIVLIHQLFVGPPLGEMWQPWDVVALFAAWVGFFLPFACFAGGLTTPGLGSARAVLLRGVVLAVISYFLMAYGFPLANEAAQAEHGVAEGIHSHFGAETPSMLRTLRAAAKAGAPDQYSFRIERLSDRPPNWLTYLIHSRYALALFGVLATLLGHRAGSLTSGLSPPALWNARWTLGLMTALLFFVAEAAGGEWVRQNPSNSGLLGAWLPLLVPLLALLLLHVLLQRRRSGLHASAPPGV
jgi:hypothetical protein